MYKNKMEMTTDLHRAEPKSFKEVEIELRKFDTTQKDDLEEEVREVRKEII